MMLPPALYPLLSRCIRRCGAACTCIASIMQPGCATLILDTIGCNACETAVVLAPEDRASPLAAALAYLAAAQLQADGRTGNFRDWAGNWPQCFAARRDGPYVRDVSPFAVAFVHNGLTLITPEHADALGLAERHVRLAATMRRRAVSFMIRFRSGPPDRPDGVGFWPIQDGSRSLLNRGLAVAIGAADSTRYVAGDRLPMNIPYYPRRWGLCADSDDTAVVFAALLSHQALDADPPVAAPTWSLFGRWRDIDHDAVWRPAFTNAEPTGAFLTWHEMAPRIENDVDPIVNANVLFALGRAGRLDVPGVDESARFVSGAVQSATRGSRTSLYYANNHVLHYVVSRAYADGGVRALADATQTLADDLVRRARWVDDEVCMWDRGDPCLDTALAASTLIHAGRGGRELAGAIRYLVRSQAPTSGSWPGGVFFRGEFKSGAEIVWVSAATTTGFALEALCKYKLKR